MLLPPALLIASAAGSLGCGTAYAAVERAPLPLEAAVSGDICVVITRLDIRVSDPRGAPIPGAEVWEVIEPILEPPEPTRAILRSSTDTLGRADAPDCLMGRAEFSQWRLDPAPLRRVFLVVHEGYGSRRVVLNVPATDVLERASMAGPQGLSFSVSPTGTAILDLAYRLSASVTLPPVKN